MSSTEFDPLNSEIWNCDKLLEFRCSQRWQGLTETSNPKQRYCQACQKNVHLWVVLKRKGCRKISR